MYKIDCNVIVEIDEIQPNLPASHSKSLSYFHFQKKAS